MTRVSPRRVFGIVLTATLLLQTAWILALPAFRGIDEFDHVFKAEAVAQGQFLDAGPAENGRGGLVTVRKPVAAAAANMCSGYEYTGPDNCHAVADLGNGTVQIASAASRYNPVYYAVVGTLAKPFSGAAANFAMRAYTAILCALLIAWAAVATASWARSAWPLLALLIAATPVLMYSTVVTAPNGVGYAAGLLFWAAGLGVVVGGTKPRAVALCVAASTMMVAHPTGPVWVLASAWVIALLQPWSRWRDTWKTWRGRLGSAAVIIFAAAVACAGWVLLAVSGAPGGDDEALGSMPPNKLLEGLLVWPFQTVAAFPLRRDVAPVLVYVLWFVLFAGLMVLGSRRATRRIRVSAAVLLGLWILVPVAFTYQSYDRLGMAWQGRYALPLAVGFAALAGFALDRARKGPTGFMMFSAVMMSAAAHTVSVVNVALQETDRGLSATFAPDVPAGIAFIGFLALSSSAVWLLLAKRTRPSSSDTDLDGPAQSALSC